MVQVMVAVMDMGQAPIDEDPAFVGLLLEHLSDPHPGARQAAARGLQQVGGVDQVAPLLAAKEAHKLDRSFARAVDHAVTAIQHVLSGREAGGLALSKEAEGGELSVTEAQGGQLAVSREPDKS